MVENANKLIKLLINGKNSFPVGFVCGEFFQIRDLEAGGFEVGLCGVSVDSGDWEVALGGLGWFF